MTATTIDATDTHFLQCRECTTNGKQEITHYLIRAIPKHGGREEVLRLTPEALVSVRKFKAALLGRRIFYSASKAKHDENLRQLFREPPEVA